MMSTHQHILFFSKVSLALRHISIAIWLREHYYEQLNPQPQICQGSSRYILSSNSHRLFCVHQRILIKSFFDYICLIHHTFRTFKNRHKIHRKRRERTEFTKTTRVAKERNFFFQSANFRQHLPIIGSQTSSSFGFIPNGIPR